MSKDFNEAHCDRMNRRCFLTRTTLGLGATAFSTLLNPSLLGSLQGIKRNQGPMFQPKAKRVIYLFMSGGPSHMDTFDFKPAMRDIHGMELPDSVRQGQRITGLTSGQRSLPCVAPMFQFNRYGQNGAWVTELLPYTASIIDEITIVKSLHTEAINHDPAKNMILTGSEQPGKPSVGSWLSYGLGSENEDMPSFVVMISTESGDVNSLNARLWGSGFLPSEHQGVNLRSTGDPVLYLSNPEGVTQRDRRNLLDGLAKLNKMHFESSGDPETNARIAQYELAFRMQTTAPAILTIKNEPESTFKLYGEAAKTPGTFAANCLRARKLAESGVRFIQLFHRGWDHHEGLPKNLRQKCREIDQASAGLIMDLKQRGLLEDTLVIWGGEFGRTIYSEGELTKDNHGRDHHGRCFTMWFAGGGVKAGFEYGETDDFAYNIVRDPVHIRDLNATILHQLGIDHNQLTFRHQGLDQKLTGVEEEARVVREILA